MGAVLKRAELVAQGSPRQADYRLWIEQITDGYLVRKESGTAEKVLHREAWFRPSRAEAEEFYQRILRRKTDPKRKSPRRYALVDVASVGQL